MKQITFKLIVLLLLIFKPFISSAYHNGDFGSVSGNWSSISTWEIYSGGIWIAASGLPTSSDAVYILSGSTVVLNSAEVSCYRLTVESGAKIWANAGGTGINYIDVYGDSITCNGTIGNPNLAIFDGISFDVDGSYCIISGSGVYNGSHIRKYSSIPATTNLTIAMNITLCFGDSTNMAAGRPTDNTAIYNHQSGSTFNITFAAGYTTNLVRYTAGGAGHTCNTNIAISGSDGRQPPRSGTFTINGTVNVSGLTIMCTSAIPPYYARWVINNGGLLNTTDLRTDINCGGSCTGTDSLFMYSGSKIKITGTPFLFNPYSTINNAYILYPGSTIEYAGLGRQSVDVNLQYANLILSGKGEKAANPGTLTIHGDLTISSGDTLAPNPAINIGGNWNDYGTKGFLEKGATGTVTSTVTFNGNTDQTITVPGGESFVNVTVNKGGGYLNLDSATNAAMVILDTLNFISGIIKADSSDLGYNLVVFLNSTSVSIGANNASFVNGLIKRNGSTPFTYPVGKVSEYRPITIGSFPDNQIIWAQYFHQNPDNGAPYPSDYDTSQYNPPINHVSGCEYWTLQSLSSDVADFINLSWDENSCGVSDTAGLLIATRDSAASSKWTSLGNGGVTGNLSQGTISSLSSVTFNSNINAYTFNLQVARASFTSGDTSICPNDCIGFNNLSSNASSFRWYFPGAADSVSTDQYPQNICYGVPGTYDVTLVATNTAGSDSITLRNYIHVLPVPPSPVFEQTGNLLYFHPDSSYLTYQWYFGSSLLTGETDTAVNITQDGNYNVLVTNKNGCKIGGGTIVNDSLSTGIDAHTDAGFKLYPNPASNSLQFTVDNLQNADSQLQINIYNVIGEKMLCILPNARYQLPEVLDISSLPAGIYFLQLKSANGVVVKRFVKE